MDDFINISYLKKGNAKQQAAFKTLREIDIFEHLKSFDPILVGTIPIAIDIENSDLDIICCCENPDLFVGTLRHYFDTFPDFVISKKTINDVETVLVRFMASDFEIEVFGQQVPSRQQPGYRHMIIENALLNQYGENFRAEVIALKREGYKTEPAFAKLLHLSGDPYLELLKYEDEINRK